ncbi:hypothetical protein MHYP_G00246460 [Metynnis hypsauchen]
MEEIHSLAPAVRPVKSYSMHREASYAYECSEEQNRLKCRGILSSSGSSSVTPSGYEEMLRARDTFLRVEKASRPHWQASKKCQRLLAGS